MGEQGLGTGRDVEAEGRALLAHLFRLAGHAEPDSLAERLVRSAGGVAAAITADMPTVPGLEDRASLEMLTTVRSVMTLVLRKEAMAGAILSTREALLDYLHAAIAHRASEQLVALFLDARCRLISEEVLARGGPNTVDAYPRDLFARALTLGAHRIILAHNHPSGDPLPSAEDIAMTKHLAAIGRSLDIEVDDHIIISRTGWSSLKAANLL